MTERKSLLKTALAALLAAVMVWGCPQTNSTSGRAVPGSKKDLAIRIQRLNVQYEILAKDAPSQVDTLPFRQKISDAQAALDAGDLAEAALLVEELEAWMKEAGPRYYQQRRQAIENGDSPEKGEDIMKKALALKARGDAAKSEGDEWRARQFYDAAVEEGELAILAESRTPDQAVALMSIYPDLERIYRAAGRGDEAQVMRRKVVAHVASILRELEQQISSRLSGKAPGYDQDTLAKSRENFNKAAAEVEKLNQQYEAVGNAARQRFPEENFPRTDFSSGIANWRRGWITYFDTLAGMKPKDDDNKDPDKEKEFREKLAKHNKLKAGARPAKEMGVLLEELEVYTNGPVVVVKGRVQNLRGEPIYKPRVTITGNIVSDVVDLGHYKLQPFMSSSFQLPVQDFGTDDYAQRGAMPKHELLLIFRDSPDGPDLKAISPGR